MGLKSEPITRPLVSHSTPPHVSIDRNPPQKTLHISVTLQCPRSMVEVATIYKASPAIAFDPQNFIRRIDAGDLREDHVYDFQRLAFTFQ